jgi:4-alpha-glucanotransferase
MPFPRSSGLLLHITSLPSNGGIGDLGPAAYDFANFLQAAGQTIWQVLPLSPTGYGHSPYSSISAMAGNPLLVSLEVLGDWGWIAPERLRERLNDPPAPAESAHADFDAVIAYKLPLLREAATNFLRQGPTAQREAFTQFCAEKQSWLDDYVDFLVLRQTHGNALWTNWPTALTHRDPVAMTEFREEYAEDREVEKAIQFAFDEQWRHLRAYCGERQIRMMGDVAIFVSFDSADVWRDPGMFELREDGTPVRVAGVPPDYFSATGQRWGNPLYRWDRLERDGFSWWVERMRRASELYDMTRLDHFRGFEAYWAIPGDDDTAINGKWIKAPGHALFSTLREKLGELPFIAEDLGLITSGVEALRTSFAFPGMCILQFGFGNRGAHSYLPHSFDRNTVVYTGTHDNDTTLGWWQNGATAEERAAIETYLSLGEDGPVWALIRAASASVADMCLFPLQDILGLGSEARMNVPSAAEGNWSWRFEQQWLSSELAEKLRAITDVADRTLSARLELEQNAQQRQDDERRLGF